MLGFALLAGILQGLTEFIPVSSSAHVALFGSILQPPLPLHTLAVVVNTATLGLLAGLYRRRIYRLTGALAHACIKKNRRLADVRLGCQLVVATLPAGLAGLLLADGVRAVMHNAQAMAAGLCATALLLFAASRYLSKARAQRYVYQGYVHQGCAQDIRAYQTGDRLDPLTTIDWRTALWVGCAQALAIIPGVSRSGTTIAVGVMRGLDAPVAYDFSFMLALPAGAGALILHSRQMLSALQQQGAACVVAFLAAAGAGWAAWCTYAQCVRRGALRPCAWYVVALAATVLWLAPHTGATKQPHPSALAQQQVIAQNLSVPKLSDKFSDRYPDETARSAQPEQLQDDEADSFQARPVAAGKPPKPEYRADSYLLYHPLPKAQTRPDLRSVYQKTQDAMLLHLLQFKARQETLAADDHPCSARENRRALQAVRDAWRQWQHSYLLGWGTAAQSANQTHTDQVLANARSKQVGTQQIHTLYKAMLSQAQAQYNDAQGGITASRWCRFVPLLENTSG